jgi:hypothetical protein
MYSQQYGTKRSENTMSMVSLKQVGKFKDKSGYRLGNTVLYVATEVVLLSMGSFWNVILLLVSVTQPK